MTSERPAPKLRSPATRIQEFVDDCVTYQKNARLIMPFIQAMCAYLEGDGALDQVVHAYQALPIVLEFSTLTLESLINRTEGLRFVGYASNYDLDDIDRRLLDIGMAVGEGKNLHYFLREMLYYATFTRARQMRDHWLAKGLDPPTALTYVLGAYHGFYPHDKVDQRYSATPHLGQLILSYLPESDSTVRQIMQEQGWMAAGYRWFIQDWFDNKLPPDDRLLPYLEAAWASMQPERWMWYGPLLELCFQGAPSSFTERIRDLVAQDPQRNNKTLASSQRKALIYALMEDDAARNQDLAMQCAKLPLQRYSKRKEDINFDIFAHDAQCAGLETLYRYDAVAYRALVEEALLSHNRIFGDCALDLLKNEDFAAIHPTLRRCLAVGQSQAVMGHVAAWMMQHEWETKYSDVLALLQHPAEPVRAVASDWLVEQGERIIDDVAPLLRYRKGDFRLVAARLLCRLDLERTLALVRAHIPDERVASIRQEMMVLARLTP